MKLLAIAFALAAPALAYADKPAACTPTLVGTGAARHTVCTFTAPMVIKVDAPRPTVVVVSIDPRKVVGRPATDDRFVGLKQHLKD